MQMANGALQVLCSKLQIQLISTTTEFLKTLKSRVCILQLIALRASLTGGLLLSTMRFAVPPNDPYSPCDHQSYLFPSFRT